LNDITQLKFKVIAYRKGMIMSTDYCYDWYEADEIAEDRMKHPSLYDEVRIINVQEENKK
jgi:hypothetical protein